MIILGVIAVGRELICPLRRPYIDRASQMTRMRISPWNAGAIYFGSLLPFALNASPYGVSGPPDRRQLELPVNDN